MSENKSRKRSSQRADEENESPAAHKKRLKLKSRQLDDFSTTDDEDAVQECCSEDQISTNATTIQTVSSGRDLPSDVYMISKTPLSTRTVIATLNAAEREKQHPKGITNPPVKPGAGCVFLYRTKSKDDDRFLDDQYFGFRRVGQKPIKGGLVKTYYQMRLRTDAPVNQTGNQEIASPVPKLSKKRVDVNFRKCTYWLECSKNKEPSYVLIHYLGDESVYVDQPHGNAKHDRPYTKTSSELKKKIKSYVQDRDAAPKKVYHKLIRENFNEPAGKSFEEAQKYEKIDTPRNVEQIKNFKKAKAQSLRIRKCEIDSIFELANSELAEFVLRMGMKPFDVVFAEPTLLKIAKQLIKESSKNLDLPQLLCYDTTFQLADSFVSILVMRNVFLVGDPIFPVAFVIHDQKLNEVHQLFWLTLEKLLQINPLAEKIPICTDREASIVGALKHAIPRAELISCSNHLKRDIKYWLPKHGGKQDDEYVLVQQISALLDCEEEDDFRELLEAFKQKWSQAFVIYFTQSLEDDITTSARFNVKKFAAFKNCSATNNLSESMNFLIKYETDWKELPLDVLLFKLVEMQCNYLAEFGRAFNIQQGNYRVKKKYQYQFQWTLPSYVYFTEKNFAEMVKKDLNPEDELKPDNDYSKQYRAKCCIKNKEMNQVPDQQMWVFRPKYNTELSFNVTRNHKAKSNHREFLCTCPLPTSCHHILAVKISIGDIINEEFSVHKLSVLKRNTRTVKGRSGRKKPTTSDLIANVVEADDSELFQRKKMISTFTNNNAEPSNVHQGNKAESYPNKAEFNFTEAHVQKMRIGSETDDEFRLIYNRELLPNLKDEAKCFGKYPTLKSGWIEGSLIDKVILSIIQKYSVTNVLYIGELIYQTVRHQNSIHHAAHFSHNNDGLNKDVLLVCVSSQAHWMLGAIIFRSKTICLLDTLFSSVTKQERMECFECLLKIVYAVFSTGSLPFVQSEWKLIYASDVPIQNDSSECGVNVCLMAYSLLQQTPFPTTKSVAKQNHFSNRRWMLHVLEARNGDATNPKSHRLPTKIKQFVTEQQVEVIVIRDDIHVSPCISLIWEGLKGCDGQWTVCNESLCEGDAEHADKQILCVVCRKWFHESCASVVHAKLPSYFKCQACIKICI